MVGASILDKARSYLLQAETAAIRTEIRELRELILASIANNVPQAVQAQPQASPCGYAHHHQQGVFGHPYSGYGYQQTPYSQVPRFKGMFGTPSLKPRRSDDTDKARSQE
jgi:hypothetical protein